MTQPTFQQRFEPTDNTRSSDSTVKNPTFISAPKEDNVLDFTWVKDNQNQKTNLVEPEVSPTLTGKARIHAVEKVKDAFIRPMQKWEGTIIEVDDQKFTARLRDLTLEGIDPKEEADFYFDEVHADDRPLISTGAIFYWAVSHKTDVRTGQPSIENTVYFKRQPPYTKRKIDKIMKRAAILNALIKKRKD
jgi:hypothetical protein